MLRKTYALTLTVLLLLSCSKIDEHSSAPVAPPPEEVALAFSAILDELLPDSHENLSIESKKGKACQGFHTSYSTDDNVIEALVETAKEHRLVIINEAHNRSSHRAFILQLAEALHKEGYTIFAAETFSTAPGFHEERQNALEHRGFALKRDGYYSVDPVFGQTVRRVLELGYKPVFYEIEASPADVPRENRIEIRETAQAKNLIERAIDKYPNEKTLVHVGFSHGKELPDRVGNVWMGMRIKTQRKIDPLTISQTACEGGDINERKTRLKILENPSSLHTQEGYDVLILHPQTQFENGRGTWLKDIGRKFVPVPKPLRHSTEWRYISAHQQPYEPVGDLTNMLERSQQPVSYDSLLLGPGQKHYLALEPGNYVIASYDSDLTLEGKATLQVK